MPASEITVVKYYRHLEPAFKFIGWGGGVVFKEVWLLLIDFFKNL